MAPLIPIITCQELYQLLMDIHYYFTLVDQGYFKRYGRHDGRPPRICIFDIRPGQDYTASRMIDPQEKPEEMSVNIRPEFITPYITGCRLERRVCENTQCEQQRLLFRWRSRRFIDKIIFMDWASTDSTVSETHPFIALRTILTERDPGFDPPEYVMLNGGFQEWLSLYPQLTSNPNVRAPYEWSSRYLLRPLELLEYLKDFPPAVPQAPVWPAPSPVTPKRNANSKKILQLLADVEEVLSEQKLQEKEEVKKRKEMLARCKYKQDIGQMMTREFKEIQERARELEQRSRKKEEMIGKINQKFPWMLVDKQEKLMREEKINMLKKQIESVKKTQKNLFEQLEKLIQPEGHCSCAPVRSRRPATESIQTSVPRRRSTSQPRLSLTPEESDVMPMEVNVGQFPDLPQESSQSSQRSLNVEDQMSAIYGNTTPGTSGLRNPDGKNMCYCNNIVQCLSNLSPINNFFVKNRRIYETIPPASTIFSLVMRMLWSGKYKSLSIKVLKQKVAERYNMFNNDQQQDTHEFLKALLSLLHDELKGDRMNSIILDVFCGKMRSVITCEKCKHTSSNIESCSDLIIAVPKEGINYFKNAIDKSLIEQLQWKCPGCQAEGQTEKINSYAQLSRILVIVLNRFTNDLRGHTLKNSAHVQYPLMLTMSVGEGERQREMEYKLRGVSCHFGQTISQGHYTSMCRNLENGRWYVFDDLDVNEVTEQKALDATSHAYVLFYSLGRSYKRHTK